MVVVKSKWYKIEETFAFYYPLNTVRGRLFVILIFNEPNEILKFITLFFTSRPDLFYIFFIFGCEWFY